MQGHSIMRSRFFTWFNEIDFNVFYKSIESPIRFMYWRLQGKRTGSIQPFYANTHKHEEESNIMWGMCVGGTRTLRGEHTNFSSHQKVGVLQNFNGQSIVHLAGILLNSCSCFQKSFRHSNSRTLNISKERGEREREKNSNESVHYLLYRFHFIYLNTSQGFINTVTTKIVQTKILLVSSNVEKVRFIK